MGVCGVVIGLLLTGCSLSSNKLVEIKYPPQRECLEYETTKAADYWLTCAAENQKINCRSQEWEAEFYGCFLSQERPTVSGGCVETDRNTLCGTFRFQFCEPSPHLDCIKYETGSTVLP